MLDVNHRCEYWFDKQAHIVDDGGREQIIPKEKDQVDCPLAKIAEDGRTAGG
jgi:hypothetical protein